MHSQNGIFLFLSWIDMQSLFLCSAHNLFPLKRHKNVYNWVSNLHKIQEMKTSKRTDLKENTLVRWFFLQCKHRLSPGFRNENLRFFCGTSFFRHGAAGRGGWSQRHNEKNAYVNWVYYIISVYICIFKYLSYGIASLIALLSSWQYTSRS